jgi:hypothetical protein
MGHGIPPPAHPCGQACGVPPAVLSSVSALTRGWVEPCRPSEKEATHTRHTQQSLTGHTHAHAHAHGAHTHTHAFQDIIHGWKSIRRHKHSDTPIICDDTSPTHGSWLCWARRDVTIRSCCCCCCCCRRRRCLVVVVVVVDVVGWALLCAVGCTVGSSSAHAEGVQYLP